MGRHVSSPTLLAQLLLLLMRLGLLRCCRWLLGSNRPYGLCLRMAALRWDKAPACGCRDEWRAGCAGLHAVRHLLRVLQLHSPWVILTAPAATMNRQQDSQGGAGSQHQVFFALCQHARAVMIVLHRHHDADLSMQASFPQQDSHLP